MIQSRVDSGLKANEATKAMSDDKLVEQCHELWTTNVYRDLEARYALGKLLDTHLGTDKGRQPYGAHVIQRIAEELKIARSELTRMRQFAQQYGSYDEFHEQHPDCRNWSEVKLQLVKSAKSDGKRRDGKKSPFHPVMLSIVKVSRALERGKVPREGPGEATFRAKLKLLVEFAIRYLQSESQPS